MVQNLHRSARAVDQHRRASESSSQPRRAPLSMYSTILFLRSTRRSVGDLSSMTKSGQRARNFSCSSFEKASSRDFRIPGRVGAPHGAIGQPEATTGVKDDADPVALGPRKQSPGDYGVPATGSKSGGRHNQHVPLGRTLNLQFTVSLAEIEELVVVHLRYGWRHFHYPRCRLDVLKDTDHRNLIIATALEGHILSSWLAQPLIGSADRRKQGPLSNRPIEDATSLTFFNDPMTQWLNGSIGYVPSDQEAR